MFNVLAYMRYTFLIVFYGKLFTVIIFLLVDNRRGGGGVKNVLFLKQQNLLIQSLIIDFHSKSLDISYPGVSECVEQTKNGKV